MCLGRGCGKGAGEGDGVVAEDWGGEPGHCFRGLESVFLVQRHDIPVFSPARHLDSWVVPERNVGDSRDACRFPHTPSRPRSPHSNSKLHSEETQKEDVDWPFFRRNWLKPVRQPGQKAKMKNGICSEGFCSRVLAVVSRVGWPRLRRDYRRDCRRRMPPRLLPKRCGPLRPLARRSPSCSPILF